MRVSSFGRYVILPLCSLGCLMAWLEHWIKMEREGRIKPVFCHCMGIEYENIANDCCVVSQRECTEEVCAQAKNWHT